MNAWGFPAAVLRSLAEWLVNIDSAHLHTPVR